MPEDELLFC